MATRLSVKKRKNRRNKATENAKAVKEGTPIKRHKIAVERSKKAMAKKAFKMT